MKKFYKLLIKSINVLLIFSALACAELHAVDIIFPDSTLEKVIREALEKPEGAITDTDMASLDTLNGIDRGIISLTGLEYAVNLSRLDLDNNLIFDIGALAGLDQLTGLFLLGNQISDISALSGLTQLLSLSLDNNQISDISALAGLTELNILVLESNQIGSISALAELSQLSELFLYDNQISDISPLAGLTRLTYIDLGANQINDLSPLSEMSQLTDLFLDQNLIDNLNPLAGLSQLIFLNLDNNNIGNLNPLAGLTQLTILSLDGNQISDISPMAEITQLNDLYLIDNQISDINPLAELSSLSYLYLNENSLDLSENSEAKVVINNLVNNFDTVVFSESQKTEELFLRASKGTFTDKIQITWQSIEGATYNLFRNTEPDTEGAVLLQSNLSVTVYDDTSVQSGFPYFYFLEIMINGETFSLSNIDGGYREQAAVGIGAWGADDEGQSTIPEGLTEVIQVDAGSIHSIALRSNGTDRSLWG